MIIISEHKEHYKIEDISKHIKAADTLLDFPEEFGKFDIVIGNPPYVRHELIKELKPTLKKEYEVYHGRADLYTYFFEKAIKLLKENGIMSFICSNTYTTAAFAKKLRGMLLENTILKYTDHTGEDLFNASVNTSSIFIQKSKPSKNNTIIVNNKYNLQQTELTKEAYKLKEETVKLLTIPIRTETNTIGQICYTSRGMGLSSKQKGEFTKADLISETKDDIHKFEYIEGKNVKAYEIENIKYIEQSEELLNKIASPRFPELYSSNKILIKRIGEKHKATYDDQQIITHETLIDCVLWKDLKGINNNSIGNVENREELENISEQYNPKYIVAILNSPVGKFLTDREGSLGTLSIGMTNNIQIAKADKETQNKIAEQVDIMMDKNASNNAKANAEATINKTIYEIYQLTEEEIDIINDNY